ncbi:MAG: MBL fold metallo-hydrolase, partial [Myxococcales bacterium]|nr:MBL fold metallo-hydrolase [Myxococcales bacterium]
MFLGHQGWLLSTATTHVLVDPLLTAGFGHGGGLGWVYPPRRVDLAAFPPLDAVIVTHEHDDHFDLPSLACIDRAVPVYLSARSSIAAHEVLGHMGFGVRPLHADRTLALGDLRYGTFAADHRGAGQGDEWDVFPFVAHDTEGHGSLLSSIDVAPPPGMLAAVAQRVPRPGIWAHANNVTSSRFQDLAPASPARPDDREALARVAVRRRAQVVAQWGAPVATLVCGGGWSFGGERAWLDHHAFPLPHEVIGAALAEVDAEHPVLVPVPGQTITTQ